MTMRQNMERDIKKALAQRYKNDRESYTVKRLTGEWSDLYPPYVLTEQEAVRELGLHRLDKE